MTSSTTHKSNIIPQENWKQQHDVVTHNDVIDAYLSGKKAGRNEWQIAMVKLFETNLKKAQQASEDLYSKLADNGLKMDSIHLKSDNPTNFMILLIATLEDYTDPKFLDAIAISRKIKSQLDSSDFTINFLFTYTADSLNKRAISSDGYFLTFYGNK